jgi:hypothetical protein
MATETDIEVVEDNDSVLVVTCRVDGVPVDLTDTQVEFFLKATKATAESDAVQYSTTNGAVTLFPQETETLGQCRVQVSAADIATPGHQRYRLDVIRNDKRLTFAYGRFVIRDV